MAQVGAGARRRIDVSPFNPAPNDARNAAGSFSSSSLKCIFLVLAAHQAAWWIGKARSRRSEIRVVRRESLYTQTFSKRYG